MNKIVMVALALALASGIAYAADQAKKLGEPVTTVVEDTGAVAETAVQGTVDTLNVAENNPVTTAADTTVKVAEGTVKTATFQKVDRTTGKK